MIEKIVAAILAFISGFFAFRMMRRQVGRPDTEAIKAELEDAEEEATRQAAEENEIALEQLREISDHIESADMGELVELINETFGPKK